MTRSVKLNKPKAISSAQEMMSDAPEECPAASLEAPISDILCALSLSARVAKHSFFLGFLRILAYMTRSVQLNKPKVLITVKVASDRKPCIFTGILTHVKPSK